MNAVSTDIQTKINKHGERIYYSLVLKESESKFQFNERLIVLVEEKYFGYIKEFDKKNLEMSCDTDKIKKKINTKDIRKVNTTEDQVVMTMNEYEKGYKQKSLKWVFKMPSSKAANCWTELIEKENSPFPSRKTTEQKEREIEPSPDKSYPKSPLINELPLNSEISRKKDDNTIRSEANTVDNRIKEVTKELFINEKSKESEVPKRTFSFRDQKEEENIQIVNFANKPNANLEKARKIETNLSNHLESKVNFNIIETELGQIQEQRKSKSRGEFRQLSENLTNREKEIQNINFLNYFRERPGEIDDKRFQDFYCFCEIKMKELLLQNFEDQLSIKKWFEFIEKKNAIKVTILLTELKEIPGNSNICDEGHLKSYLDKIKNLDFLWKVISGNDFLSEVFKVPMSCMVEFQGVTAFFTCLFPAFSEPYAVSRNQDFSILFEALANETKINKITFENSNSIKFVKISHKEIAISSVGEFLPRLSTTGNLIRPELFSQIEWKAGEDYFVKMGKKEEEQQNRYFKKPINEAIITLAKNLNKLEEYVVHPNEFSPLLHLYGLNISSMSEIYKRVDNIFIKGIIKTEAALRSFKTVYRKKMQELLISIAEKEIGEERNGHILAASSKSMLNILLGKSEGGSLLWEMVTLHSQINFKMVVSRGEINKGYFLLGLQHHLGLNLEISQNECSKMFEIDTFVSSVEFVTKMKACKLFWINDEICNFPLNKVAENLIKNLNLREKQIPFYIYQNRNCAEKIFDILSTYYPPNSSTLKHLRIYKHLDQNTHISLYTCLRTITQIKWTLKAEAEVSSTIGVAAIEEKLMKLKAELSFYFEQFHPFYSEIYDLLISLYDRQGNFDKVQHYLKSSMTNIIQLCGGNTMHLRLANNYYQKGEFLQNWGHSEEAIGSLKKAKNILEFNEYTKAREYAVIELKLAALYLNKQKDNDCYKLLASCLSTFCKMANIHIDMIPKYSRSITHSEIQQTSEISLELQTETYNNIVECLELMNRCTLSGLPDRKSTVFETSLVVLTACIEPNNPDHTNCFQDILGIRLIKLIIENYLSLNHKQINEEMMSLVNLLGDQMHVGSHRSLDPASSLLLIKEFVINNIFTSTLQNFAIKSKDCIPFIIQNPILSKNMPSKEIENFYELIRSILIVVGEGFLLGILNDYYD